MGFPKGQINGQMNRQTINQKRFLAISECKLKMESYSFIYFYASLSLSLITKLNFLAAKQEKGLVSISSSSCYCNI